MILHTRSNSILKSLRASRLDIESEKHKFSIFARRMRSMATVIAYSSALKMFALYGTVTELF